MRNIERGEGKMLGDAIDMSFVSKAESKENRDVIASIVEQQKKKSNPDPYGRWC